MWRGIPQQTQMWYNMVMFGRGRTQKQDYDTQVPYEVYQTVQEPTDRRRQWIIRLVAALVVVTLLVLGGTALYRALHKTSENSKKPGTTQHQGIGSTGQQPQNDQTPPPDAVKQDPQQNNGLPNTGSTDEPATTPQSGSTNDSTVRKPD
jgi:hypothetical protein